MSKIMMEAIIDNMKSMVEPIVRSRAVLTGLMATEPRVQNAYKEA